MKINRLFYPIFFLVMGICYPQVTINNIQIAVTNISIDASTPNNPSSYIWSEISNTKQGVHISLTPPEKAEISLQLNNSWINYNTWNWGYMIRLEIQYDGGSWQTIFTGQTKDATGWIQSPFSTLGHHTITVKWESYGEVIYYRDYDVYVVPQCQKVYKDNTYGNTLTLWDGGNPNKVILVSEGFDPYNITYSEYLRYKGKYLFDRLLQAGYKIYFLNYAYNSQDMRNTAAIFNSASNYVSSINANNTMVAAGISMGGVVVRYALAKAENDGNPLPFYKFVSIDAPQKGAVFDKPLQDYFKNGDISDLQRHGLKNDAGKQLLTYNAYGSLHTSFYNELNSLNGGTGYPTLTENIGVSFSNGTANPGNGRWVVITYEPIFLPGNYIVKTSDLYEEIKVAGSYLPRSLVESGLSPLFLGMAEVDRDPNNNPTFIPYTSSLDIVNGNSKFDKTIHANANYFHDEFPPEIIDTLLKSVMDPYLITTKKEFEFDVVENSIDKAYYGFPFTFSVPLVLPKNGRTYNFAGWSDDFGATNTRTIAPAINKTYTALYKYPNHSNTSNTFANNGQRKIIRIDAVGLVKVYESLDRVWIETSSDNGTTWVVGNNGRPLTKGKAKLPAITQIGQTDFVIVAQTERSNCGYFVMAYHCWGDMLSDSAVVTEVPNKLYSENANPVIASQAMNTPNFLIVWEEADYGVDSPGGLHYRYGNSGGPLISWLGGGNQYDNIAGTDQNSHNPAIATVFSNPSYSYPLTFHLVWQQNGSTGYSDIMYRKISASSSNSLSFSSISNKSSNHYAQKHMNPSVIEFNGEARIVWKSEYDVFDDGEQIAPSVVFHSSDYPAYWDFGNYTDVNSPVINRPEGVNAYVFGWTENNGSVGKLMDNYLSASHLRTIATTGKDMQLSNGSSLSNMYALQFNNTTLPYNFNRSNSIGSYYGLQKENSNASISVARTGVAIKEKGRFFYSLGDIYVDNGLIEFEELDRNNTLVTKENLTNSIVSKPFILGPTSSLTYSVTYGMNNMTKGKEALGDNGEIHFRVEVLDANTNEVLGSFDEMKYSKMNLAKYSNIGYKVNAPGLLGKSIKLRLHADDNLEAKYVIVENMQTGTSLAKKTFKEVELKQNEVVTDYGLDQNYPNPFNPATTITYQLPQSGSVTLKIFDILGNEVKTLVNENKEMGKYTVQFDASSLASGMYVYQLRANDYTSTKKMLLLK